MGTALSIIIAALITLPANIHWLVSTAALLLMNTFLARAGGWTSPLAYVLGALFLGAIFVAIAGVREGWPKREEIFLNATLLCSYLVFLLFALSWSDYDGTAERLRDLAVLGSAYRNPLTIEDPWFANRPITYYTFWYQWARMVGISTGTPHLLMYHQLVAFAFSLLFTSSIFFFRTHQVRSWVWAVIGALLVTMGGNVASLVSVWRSSDDWWGPSRVVTGGINEFPAWSFLLGDAHPHFLSLGLLPLFLGSLALLLQAKIHRPTLIVSVGALVLASMGVIANANLWDIPLWFLTILATISSVTPSWRQPALTNTENFLGTSNQAERDCVQDVVSDPRQGFVRGLLLLLLLALLAFGMYYSFLSTQLKGAALPIKFVSGAISRTPLKELLWHWGWQIGLFAISALGLLRSWGDRAVVLILLSIPLAGKGALPLLLMLLVSALLLVYRQLQERRSIVGTLIFSAGTTIIILPELLYFDDPYGGVNERMNTIFKFYNFAWFPLYAGAFLNLRYTVSLNRLPHWLAPLILLLPFVTVGFFVRTGAKLRPITCSAFQAFWRGDSSRWCFPDADGLDLINKKYPGAREAVKTLAEMPRLVILESQGEPYSLTSHVASTSAQSAYLGWANHINVYTRDYQEVARRGAVAKQIYETLDCAARLALTRGEGVDLIVVGPLERERFPAVAALDFGCFKVVVKNESYAVYDARSS